MIDSIYVEKFKSLWKQNFELAPITIFIGRNNSGKSSVLQALGVLQEFHTNPGRALDGLFALHRLNMGSFRDVVYKHNDTVNLVVGIDVTRDDIQYAHRLSLGPNPQSSIEFFSPFEAKMSVPIDLPYSSGVQAESSISYRDSEFTLIWDGLQLSVENGQDFRANFTDLVPEAMRNIGILFAGRGFYEPQYQLDIAMREGSRLSDAQVASLLHDVDVEELVMSWTEDVFGVQVRAKETPPEIALVSRAREFSPKLVNEGLGLNQMTYIFALLAVFPENSLICIEEPEISLHPAAQSKLADVFVEASRMNKRMVFTTHSEHLLIAFLTKVAKGDLKPDDLAVYFFERKRLRSTATRLEVTERGQLKGGLRGFFEHEMESALGYIQALSEGK